MALFRCLVLSFFPSNRETALFYVAHGLPAEDHVRHCAAALRGACELRSRAIGGSTAPRRIPQKLTAGQQPRPGLLGAAVLADESPRFWPSKTRRGCGEYWTTATATGRLAMNDPNLQTIPHPYVFEAAAAHATNDDDGASLLRDVPVRAAFVTWGRPARAIVELAAVPGQTSESQLHNGSSGPAPRLAQPPPALVSTATSARRLTFAEAAYTVFLSADYAQVEARILVHLSQDPAFCFTPS